MEDEEETTTIAPGVEAEDMASKKADKKRHKKEGSELVS